MVKCMKGKYSCWQCLRLIVLIKRDPEITNSIPKYKINNAVR
jgi:hypothetical protein